MVDEVHHAPAASYRRVLAALQTSFLLGLTATPDRLDGGDVLGLFGDHVFYRADLGEGVARGHLVPFRYHGLKDTVAYEGIPWRAGRFDGEALAAAVDTHARFDKLWEAWVEHPGERTLVFCASKSHATHVREALVARGVTAHTVFGDGGTIPRQEALRALAAGLVQALVTVDLFNEGVDVPAIDRVVMLRPTESNVIFLQQLGRGLRRAEGKRELTVIDFVGNHRVFLWKVEALLSLVGHEATTLRDFLAARGTARMPPGCTLDLELESKEILAKLLPAGRSTFEWHYDRHVESHGGRPTAGEMFRAGLSLDAVRTRERGWFDFVASRGHLTDAERRALDTHRSWLRELETMGASTSSRLVLLEALLDAGALYEGMALDELADCCRQRIARDGVLRRDVENVTELEALDGTAMSTWRSYWRENPVEAWLRSRWFVLEGSRLVAAFSRASGVEDALAAMTSELVDLRLAQYRRRHGDTSGAEVHLCSVTWNKRDPILSLPAALQAKGDFEARVSDGRMWVFRCMKAFCNVAHPVGSSRNGLPDLLRGWFGPDAGRPGTSHMLRFRRSPDGWWVEPVGITREVTGASDLIACYPTLAAAAGTASGSTGDAPESSAVRLPVVASRELFAVRASGSSMDGGRAPIRDGDWCVLRWMRGAAVAALRDRVVLVQTAARDEGLRLQLKRLVERDEGWRFVSDASEGPTFAADDATVVLARVEQVVRPESLGPAVGARLTDDEIAQSFGWRTVSRSSRIEGHRTLWIDAPGTMTAPDRVKDDGAARHPGETAFVFTRTHTADAWRYGGVARRNEREALWACEAVDHTTWKALGGGRTASRTLPEGTDARVEAWITELVRVVGVGRVAEAGGHALRVVGRSKGGGLRVDGGDGGFSERSVSRTDLAWVLLAADDVRANGGVLDEARVNKLRYLDGTPKGATRWIDTGHAIRLMRLAPPA